MGTVAWRAAYPFDRGPSASRRKSRRASRLLVPTAQDADASIPVPGLPGIDGAVEPSRIFNIEPRALQKFESGTTVIDKDRWYEMRVILSILSMSFSSQNCRQFC
jgi:hypothetical protein